MSVDVNASRQVGSAAVGRDRIDLNATGTVNGKPIFDLNMEELSDKPWLQPGADISDWFNYGLDESTWRLYCERQKQLRAEISQQRSIAVHTQGGDPKMMPGGGMPGNQRMGLRMAANPMMGGMNSECRGWGGGTQQSISLLTVDACVRVAQIGTVLQMRPPNMFPGGMMRMPPPGAPGFMPGGPPGMQQQWGMRGPPPPGAPPLPHQGKRPGDDRSSRLEEGVERGGGGCVKVASHFHFVCLLCWATATRIAGVDMMTTIAVGGTTATAIVSVIVSVSVMVTGLQMVGGNSTRRRDIRHEIFNSVFCSRHRSSTRHDRDYDRDHREHDRSSSRDHRDRDYEGRSRSRDADRDDRRTRLVVEQ